VAKRLPAGRRRSSRGRRSTRSRRRSPRCRWCLCHLWNEKIGTQGQYKLGFYAGVDR
jgi:hypothetical protein